MQLNAAIFLLLLQVFTHCIMSESHAHVHKTEQSFLLLHCFDCMKVTVLAEVSHLHLADLYVDSRNQ